MKQINNNLDMSWDYLINKKYENAINYSSKAIESGESTFLPYYIIGLSLFNLGRISESIRIVYEGLIKFPNQTDLLAIIGGCLIQNNQVNEAETILKKALLINQNNGLAWSHLSWTYFNQRRYKESLEAAQKALSIQPGDSGAKCNLAGCLKEMREVEESIRLYKEVIQENPKMNAAWIGLLFTIIFSENYDPLDHLNIVKSYAKTIKKTSIEDFVYKDDGSDKIKIGILSEDIRIHPCAYMLIPFVANINKKIASINVYCLNKSKDSVTTKVKNISNRFIDVSNLNDEEIIKTIRSDNLHVLIDLGGYTGTSPLKYMVNKLAKFQCSWLGYPASSQMKEIDFRIADFFGNIPSQDSNYTETLLKNKYISTTYTPLVYRPLMVYDSRYSVKESPFNLNGYITFGSCNNLGKVSNKTLELWSRVLLSVPNSRMLIEADNLDVTDVASSILKEFNKFGINSERIIFIKRDTSNQYLTYNLIDIALDTTPLTGGTTTFDCLWMGVPLITKTNEFFHTRMSGVILNAVGLDELVTNTDEDYVNKAIELSFNSNKLNKIRNSLRSKYENSPIMDHTKFCNWFLSCIHSEIKPNEILNIPNDYDYLYFDGTVYSIEKLKEIIILLMEKKDFKKILILLENMSTKWSKSWIIAFTLSEIDLLEGREEESLFKLDLSIQLNKYSIGLNRLWLYRTSELKEEFIQNHFIVNDSDRFDSFMKMPVPKFNDVLMEKYFQ